MRLLCLLYTFMWLCQYPCNQREKTCKGQQGSPGWLLPEIAKTESWNLFNLSITRTDTVRNQRCVMKLGNRVAYGRENSEIESDLNLKIPCNGLEGESDINSSHTLFTFKIKVCICKSSFSYLNLTNLDGCWITDIIYLIFY